MKNGECNCAEHLGHLRVKTGDGRMLEVDAGWMCRAEVSGEQHCEKHASSAQRLLSELLATVI